MKTREFSISTDHEGMYNITARLREVIRESGVQSGLAVVYCPHTTAGITVEKLSKNASKDTEDITIDDYTPYGDGAYDAAEQLYNELRCCLTDRIRNYFEPACLTLRVRADSLHFLKRGAASWLVVKRWPTSFRAD